MARRGLAWRSPGLCWRPPRRARRLSAQHSGAALMPQGAMPPCGGRCSAPTIGAVLSAHHRRPCRTPTIGACAGAHLGPAGAHHCGRAMRSISRAHHSGLCRRPPLGLCWRPPLGAAAERSPLGPDAGAHHWGLCAGAHHWGLCWRPPLGPVLAPTIGACAGAHHWGRVLAKMGHEVRLIPAREVKPFVRLPKTDAGSQ